MLLADCKTTIMNTKTIETISNTVKAYSKSSVIVWRTFAVITNVVIFNEDIASQITSLDLHELGAKLFHDFPDEPNVQQQVWL